MRYTLTLAAIPLPLLMWATWPAQPVPVTAVATEGVRAQRQDDNTFRLRWSAVDALPPATVVWEVPVEAAARTAPPARLVRRAALRGVNGVCAKHGMHKVHYGRRWRCRK
jgi:hypothetical protein